MESLDSWTVLLVTKSLRSGSWCKDSTESSGTEEKEAQYTAQYQEIPIFRLAKYGSHIF